MKEHKTEEREREIKVQDYSQKKIEAEKWRESERKRNKTRIFWCHVIA